MSSAAQTRERIEDALFTAGYWAVFGLLLLPIVVVIATSFQASQYLQFPPTSFSLKWYVQFFESPRWLKAVFYSVTIGIGTAICSSILGVTGSLAVQRSDSRWVQVLPAVILMPLLIPPVVLGLTLLIYFNNVGIDNNVLRVVMAHTLWATPLVFFIMQSVFARFDWNLRDAGADLGARPHEVFYHVILPNVRSGLVISAMVAFIVSLQEFVMALFLTSFGTRTIPVLAWTELQQSLTPMVSVVSTFLVVSSAIAVLVSAALMNLEWLAKQL
ncbi:MULTISPECIES: ABC transporter permease [unclassified Haloparvum]|uniref:ABC transporter permease n=1 Tax=Haloparvum sp. PAK95 TaxID=3418962 RepID=UPI003D2F4438